MATYSRAVYTNEKGITIIPTITQQDAARTFDGGQVDVWAESATQLYPLGSKAMRGCEVWRYCKAGGTGLNIAAPVQQAKAAHAEQDDDIVCGAAAAIGAYSVEVTSTANLDTAPNDSANDFAEGFLIVNDEAGEGQCLRIKSNEALSGTADSTFTLYDPLSVALTTSSELGLVRNPYYKVIATEAVVSGMVIGIPQFAVTANYYFWCKTGGPAAAVPQAAIALGTSVCVGTTAAKVNASAAATTELIIGWAMTPGVADTESMIVFLTLDS
ncbi:MAG: hypothetical protein SVY53_03200 [Chloroflexota bacterium]|nr:hypothetical protein [Chloroflexota bacterium]